MSVNDEKNRGSAVLELLLKHEPGILDCSSLGALSICNKHLMALTEPQWKAIWERYVEIGAEFKPDLRGDSGGLTLQTWCGENGLLNCFTDPVIVEACPGGYKHAAGCLKTKVCFKCGDMASEAHPITLTRLCEACVDEDQESWIITKSKAKDTLLLGEADLKRLRSVSIPSKTLTGKDATSVVFLVKDAVQSSLAKHGGKDGLEAAFEEKKTAALAKYERSQSTEKPQKKKPKVMKMSKRPTEDWKDIRGWFTTLPIGVMYAGNRMTHAAACLHCHVRGCAHDIVLHARLEHGQFGADVFVPNPDLNPPNEGAFALLSVPYELKQVIAGTSKSRGRQESEADDITNEWLCCGMTFGDDGLKVTVDMTIACGECMLGAVTIAAQLRSKAVPFELLSIGLGEACDMCDLADEKTYQRMIKALGLEETKPSDLLAALILEALPANEFLREVEWAHLKENDKDDMGQKLLQDACKLLKEATAYVSEYE